MANLGAPVSVSPLLKVARWGLLFTGIAYGYYRFARLEKKEKIIQDQYDIIRAKRDKRLATESAMTYKNEMNQLAEEFGIENRVQ